MNNLTYSKSGLALTELFEGDVLTAYQDQKGVWTIGYGHTAGVQPGQKITQLQAETFLLGDVGTAVNCVNEAVEVTLTQAQFDALVDFTFNLGAGNFEGSTLLKDINAGDFPAAIAQFKLWDHCGGVVNAGLLRRRNAEAAEFAGSTSSSSTPANKS
ncbi:MAG: lysozyme [Silvibacterium sp.]|nr:lysozyme [Silvibacterium sp.]MBV8436222.1 lysozyme [Silvibacterium sp.]